MRAMVMSHMVERGGLQSKGDDVHVGNNGRGKVILSLHQGSQLGCLIWGNSKGLLILLINCMVHNIDGHKVKQDAAASLRKD
jgi:hypothetical protein